MSVVYLVRHGEADWAAMDARRLPGGVNDLVPLTARGVFDAERAGEELKRSGAAHVWASPMTRALQTAAVISSALRLPLSVHFDLREWLVDDTYRWDAATAEAAFREFTALGGEWPDGERRAWEPISSVRARASAVISEVTSTGQTVVVVCHGVVIQSLTGLNDVPPGGVVRYR